MGKAFTIHKNKTVPVIPHVNYMYGHLIRDLIELLQQLECQIISHL
jgi:hypothetical protein